jgi:hypothetical protein
METEVDGNDSESCQVVGFGGRAFEPSDASTTLLVIDYSLRQLNKCTVFRYDCYCTIRQSSLHIAPSLISSVLVADTSGKTGVVGVGSDGWRVEDAMINGNQAVDTAGNKNIKTPQSLSPAYTPCLPHRKYGSTNWAKSNILLILNSLLLLHSVFIAEYL